MADAQTIKIVSKIEPLQQCFVIMSFSKNPKIERPYQRGIKKVVSSLGFNCVRMDELPHLAKITDKIEECIRGAYFVIADLTENRRNCYYELGYAHGLKKPVILIARRGTKTEFDLSHYPTIFYDSEKKLSQELERWICGTVLTSAERDRDFDPQNGKFGRLAIKNGRLLTARVLRCYEDEDEDKICDLQLEVHTLPKHPILKGNVRFFVHPSYKVKYYQAKAKDGCASIELAEVGGAFTVGAVADNGKIRLELDLAMIPGVPFYRIR